MHYLYLRANAQAPAQEPTVTRRRSQQKTQRQTKKQIQVPHQQLQQTQTQTQTQTQECPRHARWFEPLAALPLLVALPLTAVAAGPPNGTTVYRCIDLNGVITFADSPCTSSVSKRLRIEHSLIQSVPLSMAEQQRLRSIEQRLQEHRGQQDARTLSAKKQRHAEANATAERCKQATLGLKELRVRKRRGYSVHQSARIENEQRALRGEIAAYCR